MEKRLREEETEIMRQRWRKDGGSQRGIEGGKKCQETQETQPEL